MKSWLAISLCCLISLSFGLPANPSPANPSPGKQAGATPAQAPPPAPGKEIHFDFGGDAAEIPAEFIANIPLLPLRVNGTHPSFFVLDSTVPGFSIDPSRATTLGIPTVQPVILSLSGLDIPIASLPAIANKGFATSVGRIYEGTLGNDFLQRVVVEIDYARQTIRLYDPSAYHYSGRGTSLHLSFSGGVPVVQAKFTEPRGKVLEGAFAVNTALSASVVISDRFAEAHHLYGSHWKTVPSVDPELDESQGVVLGRMKGFQLGRYDAPDAVATFSRSNLPEGSDGKIAGEIGGGILERFNVILDYPHQQMIVEPNAHFIDEEEEDKSGISVVATGATLKTFEIVLVAPGTPGAQAGLQKGDIISGIDNDAAADLTLEEVRDLFRQVGHKYNLLIDRSGEMKQVTVEMRRLLN